MAHGYDLLLQAAAPGEPFDLAAVERQLEVHGAVRRPDGGLVWRFDAGEVEVRRLQENGVPVATELRVPLSDRPALLGEVLEAAAKVALEAKARLVDPSLNRAVGPDDVGAVVSSFLGAARYAAELQGVSEALSAGFSPTSRGGVTGASLFWLALVIFLVAGWLGWSLMHVTW